MAKVIKSIESLAPADLWKYFLEISSIPRPSKKEEKAVAYLMDFAKKHKLQAKKDQVGNVLITKPAVKGYEKKKTVVLQSHIDMVCEKNSDVKHNFEKDPIVPFIEDGWVKAKGTTLGADDGIGIAAQLALLAAKDIPHGKIECLFTIDEETGLTGAFALKPGFFEGKILLNLDSEDEGELFIGCAGGKDTVGVLKFTEKSPDKDGIAYKISVTGLTGGHSGDDIHKGLGNSIKILNRFLWEANRSVGIRINTVDGGNLRNAIPREAFATFVTERKQATSLRKLFSKYEKEIIAEFESVEPKIKVSLTSAKMPSFVIGKKTQDNLLNLLYSLPHGVISMSHDMPGLVETSTNLASVKFDQGNKIIITTSQRSSVESAREYIVNWVETTFTLAGAKAKHSNGYPGWKPNVNSDILKVTEKSYKKLFKKTPVVRAIHAGLECGLFLEKYPDLDMISFGPTIKGAHSPDERMEIKTVQMFWDLTLDVLKNIP